LAPVSVAFPVSFAPFPTSVASPCANPIELNVRTEAKMIDFVNFIISSPHFLLPIRPAGVRFLLLR
jgi:hypothetical protein